MTDFLKDVEWREDEGAWKRAEMDPPSGLYATHHGVWKIAGVELKCYRLNNGEAVIDADDFTKFFDILSGCDEFREVLD